MKKSLLAASLLAVVASLLVAGCSENATDDSESSSNDIVSGDQRNDGTGAAYGTQKGNDAPLPDLEGNGAEGSVTANKLVKLPSSVNLKPALDIPKPPVEGPEGEVLAR